MLSILRYPGGKSRAAHFICDYFSYRPGTVVSPFFGGGSVEFLLAKRGWSVLGSDAFHPLVSFWENVKFNRESLVELVKKHYPMVPEEFYNLQNKMIEWDVQGKHSPEVAAAFYALNRASFSGSTLSGGYSPGHPRFNIESIERLKKFDGMNNISIHHEDFKTALKNVATNWWVYNDPPYYLEKDKANLYGSRGNLHRFFDHEALFQLLSERDEHWVLSYNDCEFIRDKYKNHKIIPIKWKYSMSKNKFSNEVIILSKY